MLFSRRCAISDKMAEDVGPHWCDSQLGATCLSQKR